MNVEVGLKEDLMEERNHLITSVRTTKAHELFFLKKILTAPRVSRPDAMNIQKVALAQTEQDMEAVYRLTHDRYVDMGYCLPRTDKRLLHYPHLDGISETYVILIWSGGELTGTVSLTLDGPQGLHVDDDFKPQADLVRQDGGRLASSWRIVTRADSSGQKTVMTLIGSVVYLAFEVLKCQAFLNTFHPRHERIYRKLFKMEKIGSHAAAHSLANAPAVLMRCDADRCPGRWLRKPASLSVFPLRQPDGEVLV